MVSILVLLNRISPTSIPFETVVQIAKQSPVNITIASFYDSSEKQSIDTDTPVECCYLGAESRFDLDAWRRFYRELRTGGYDILHTHQNFSGSIARILASSTAIGIITTEHRQHSSYTVLQNLVNAPTLPLADHIICNSIATNNSLCWYEQLFIDENQISIIYNGIDSDRIDLVGESVEGDNMDPTVVTVGRHVPVKNYETLIEAFATVHKRIPDATLSLIGDGPLRAQLEAQAADLGILNAVEFLGEISREEVYRELIRADVFTIPSHAEGFCVAAVEAMAVGLPVVVSDIDVLNEVVGDPGVYADPNNPTEFADAITNLLKNPQKRERLGISAKERARAKFTLERTAKKYYEVYNQVADKLC
jgi:glycosyltransferase involved in cell wall biosynthesis